MSVSSDRSAGRQAHSAQPLDALLPASYSVLPWDALIAALLFFGGLIAYVSTLAPTVLDGDAALFQYAPWVLGVTYPTGYPTYILLGQLWTALAPVGSVAFRMNLLSAVCGALALAFIYLSVRRLLENRLAGLMAVLIFATLPTFWRWATQAKIYTLHILLLSGILFLLTRCLSSGDPGTQRVKGPTEQANVVPRKPWYLLLAANLLLAAILFGLALGNHSTTLLLAPGLLLFAWLNCRPPYSLLHTPYSILQGIFRLAILLLPVVLLPLLLYLYIPLRAEQLLVREGVLTGLTVPVAVARGLVSDYYEPGLPGLIRYFTAADFTGGVVTNWGLVPGQIASVYWPLVRADFTLWGATLALIGAVYFARWRPRRFWPLFLMVATLIPFVLTYGQGEQGAFLLPSSLMLAIFAGAAIAGGLRLVSGIGDRRLGIRNRTASFLLSVFLGLALIAGVAWLPVRQAGMNRDWLSGKWNDAAQQYWADVLSHPLEPGSGVLAHWGDLTTFWYLQHVEGIRPDLYGLYPPTEEVVAEWLAAGHELYIAGPLQGWAAGVENRYQLLPWGRMVRLAPLDADPLALLPDLPDTPVQALFDHRIRLLKAGLPASSARMGGAQATSGGVLPVTLAWQTVGHLPTDTHVSLRLIEGDGTIAAQTDEALISGWLPADSLPPGQVLLSFHPFRLPTGMLPGEYRLQLAVFQPRFGPWPLADEQLTLDLGPVRVLATQPSQPVDPWNEYKPLRGINFGGEIRLVGYDYSVTRAGQGKGFAAEFLWQAIQPPAEDYVLLVELVDAEGRIWRDWRHNPTDGRAPTGTWAADQLVRDQIDLVLPANAPPGENTLRVRLSWLGSDGTRLPVQRWIVPSGNGFDLPGIRVEEKEERLFEPPALPTRRSLGRAVTSANFDDKVQLLGYDTPTATLSPGDKVAVALIWRSLTSDMRESYTVFVHLVGPDGTIHGQWDKEPGERGKQPTTSWVEGEVILDRISVPLASDAPSGTYRVLVGLYLAPEGPRLPLRDDTGKIIGDAFELTQLEVRK